MNKPLNQWRNKGLSITAWDGKGYCSFTIQKRYCDKTSNEWKETKTLFASDLEALQVLLTEAVKWNQDRSNHLDTPEGRKQFEKPSESIKIEFKSTTPTTGLSIDDDEIPF